MSSSADHWPVAHLPTDLLQSPLTATLLTSILAAVLGSLQIGYHTGNVNAPAKVRDTDGESCGHRRADVGVNSAGVNSQWGWRVYGQYLTASIKDWINCVNSSRICSPLLQPRNIFTPDTRGIQTHNNSPAKYLTQRMQSTKEAATPGFPG